MTLRYGSVCSGIEAASVAWGSLGWRPSFFSEIDPFPRAVLAHHYPKVPLHGDFTTIEEGRYEPIDLLVGGTPCQSFSVAGKRLGLDDARGNLAIEYCRLALRLRPRWVVWENVPGVLSSDGGRDFAAFLRLLGECGYGWAYRVLDAQYVRVDGFARAVPQRRNRVILVGYLGDWRRAASVLFEPEGMRWDPPPRREAAQNVALALDASSHHRRGSGMNPNHLAAVSGTLAGGARQSGGYSFDDIPLTTEPIYYGGGPEGGQISGAVTSKWVKGSGGPAGDEMYNMVAVPVSPTLRAGGNSTGGDRPPGTDVDTCDSLIPISVSMRGREGGASLELGDDLANALRASQGGGDKAFVLAPMAFNGRQDPDVTGDRSGPLNTITPQDQCVLIDWRVRRLTPRECERLQGFPDGYTDVPWRRRNYTPDGPRYKAIGNSMAVNVMRWVGQRIELAEQLVQS